MSKSKTREQIIEAADHLFYQKGYEHTSFKDIADAVRISRGNFYYHFKTKDEILNAVIELRLENTRKMLDEWEAAGETPGERIRSFIHILVANASNIQMYGCPVGTLCTELAKLDHDALVEANRIFTLFRSWLRRQFELMGRKRDSDAAAMHVLAWSQGVATLANAFQDEKLIRREVNYVCEWLERYENTG